MTRDVIEDTGPPQLLLGGGEVTTDQARRSSSAGRRPPLTGTQRQIVDRIRQEGSIRSVEAGVIVHRNRPRPDACATAGGAGADRYRGTGIACCAYASSDGLEAMKRLEARGVVKRGDIVGRWVAP